MSDASGAAGHTLPLSAVKRINDACIRFELAWQTGQRPRIEDYLADADEAERPELLRELVGLETEYRRQAGEEPAPHEYRDRFPTLALHSSSAAQTAPVPDFVPQPPPEVPGYEILGELGRGGMGVVYRARQLSLNRPVALKMIRAGAHADADELARFRLEAEALSRLRHPHVVQVYEVGQAGDCPYLVLEFVDGGNLGQRLAGTPLPPPEAARLVQQLARTMNDVHQQGIIHRDLKPANILLSFSDASQKRPAGERFCEASLNEMLPKISDFGLARLVVGGGPTLTQSGSVLGTPSYMAPEQAAGRVKDIGPATDVYALGAVLYECLTGRPPFKAATALETLQQVQLAEPVPPSRLQPRLPRDLTTICLKCLEKEPARRYATAGDLADDLHRFLAGEPIQARPIGRAGRLWRWCRRNPVVATLSAAVLVLLALLAGGALVDYFRLAEALRTSEDANAQAQVRLWESLRDQARALRRSRSPGQRVQSLKVIREALKLPVPPGHSAEELRTEAIAALAVADLEPIQEWQAFPAGVLSGGFDDPLFCGARLSADGTLSLRRLSDDVELARWSVTAGGDWPAAGSFLRLSPGGRFVCLRRERPGRLVVWRLDGPAPAVCYQDRCGRCPVIFTDGRRMAYLRDDNQVAVADLVAKETRYVPVAGATQARLQFAPDGRRFALAAYRTGQWVVEVRDAITGEVQQTLLRSRLVANPAWHPDSRTLAAGCEDRAIRLWDVSSGQVRRVLKGQRSVSTCVFSAGGDRLLSNDGTGLLRVWELSSGRQLLAFPAAVGRVDLLSVSPDDRVRMRDVADTTKYQIVRLHPGLGYRTIDLRGGPTGRGIDGNGSPQVHPGGRLLAARATDGSVVLVDLDAGCGVAQLPLANAAPMLWEPSGALLTCGTSGLLRWPVRPDPADPARWQCGPPETLLTDHSGGPDWNWGGSADGQTFAVPLANRGADVVYRGSPPRRFGLQSPRNIVSCAVSPDGRWVATGHSTADEAGAIVWDGTTGELVKKLRVPPLARCTFSPAAGRWLLTNSDGCRLWEVGTWKEGARVGGSTGCFSADGRLLAVDDAAGAIRLVRPDGGAEAVRLEAPEETRLLPRCFTPDGRRLVAVGADTEALHVWDLAALRRAVEGLGFGGDGLPEPAGAGPAAWPVPLTVHVEAGDLVKKK
jgi:serine/threonine protein kinase/WD40 repeat protein